MKLDTNMARILSANSMAETNSVNEQVERKLADRITVYKLDSTPAGGALFTYFLAILTYLGAFTFGRKVVPESSVSAFFATSTAVRYHEKNGRIERGSHGMRLTAQGLSYFQGRISGKTANQRVMQEEIDHMVEAIKTGSYPTATKNFGPKTKFRPIKIDPIG